MGAPWNDWYHCNGNTYGTWLRGDLRGWRARHHREHVDGDYKNPPAPGIYDDLFTQSKKLMKRRPVRLSPEAAQRACHAMVENLQGHDIEVIAVCMDSHHFHVLARFPDHNPRKWIGLAKKHSARVLSDEGLVARGGVWAVRFRSLPIRDRGHQVACAKYIWVHEDRGARVWHCS